MTNEEKLQLINAACDTIREALVSLREAKKMLKRCGIRLCDMFNTEVQEWETGGSHAQIFSGIGKMEKLTGKTAYYPESVITSKPDKSQKLIEHNGVRFIQVADTQVTNKYSWR